MKYLLDTNACIHYLNHNDSPIRKRMAKRRSDDVVVCSMVKAELYYGVFNSKQKEKNMDKLDIFFNGLRSLPFDDQAAFSYGHIRADLFARGIPIGPNDMIIAAIAISRNITLITHNISEFSRVQGLDIEDWQNPRAS